MDSLGHRRYSVGWKRVRFSYFVAVCEELRGWKDGVMKKKLKLMVEFF